MNTAKATLKSGRTVEFNTDMIGDGAMKEVYFTKDRKSVVCFYKDPNAATDPQRIRRLEMILGKNNPTLDRNQGGAAGTETEAAYFRDLYCWPTDVVLQPRFGLLAPTYPGNFFFNSGPDFIKGKEKNGMRFIGGRNRAMLEKFAPAELGEWRNYLALSIRMARAVSRLHNAGLAHSDLSPNNVLVDPALGKSIVIDIDSLVVEGLYPPDVLGTKGYIAPEVLATMHLAFKDPNRKFPSARTDQHALPVLIYQYLLRRHPLDGKRIPPVPTAEEQELLSYGKQAIFCEHPTDASNRPEEPNYVPCAALGTQLNELFQRAFVKGLHAPNDRPSALEWVRGLIKTVDVLLPCSNPRCSHKWMVLPSNPNDLRCPFCKNPVKTAVPLLNLRAERRPGQWMPDGQLVVYHQLALQKWHTFSGLFPGPDTDRTRQAYCLYHDRRWLLVNENLPSMTSVETGNRVAPGSAMELKHGTRIRFSQEPNGRIAEVQLLGS
jgi:serine/threonine protein kinase